VARPVAVGAGKRMNRKLKFSESGVRGVVGAGITPLLASELAAAFGFYSGGGRIAVGRDTRSTGEMFEYAVVSGLLAAGCEVMLLGVVPTPTIQFAVRHAGCSGGIAITASHNPEEWNALKFIGGAGTFLSSGEASELFDLYSQGSLPYVGESQLRGVKASGGFFDLQSDLIYRNVNVDKIRRCHFKVAVDCCNGVGALYSRVFLEKLGCEVFAINEETCGKFNRPPEPVADNLSEIAATVVRHHCDIGFAQDPDGDRLTVITDQGRVLNPHWTVALAVAQVLDSGDPGPVVVNVQTSQLIDAIAGDSDCNVVHSKVGEINVVEKMLESDAVIGGEGNCGGVIFRKVHPGRDSFAAMALILEKLAFEETSLSEIVGQFPDYVNLAAKFPAPPVKAKNLLTEFAKRYQKFAPLTFDGVCFDWPERGRVLLRSSNTEPVIRLNVESLNRQAAEELLTQFSHEIGEYLQ